MKVRLEKKVRNLEENDNDLSRPKFMYGGVPVEDILDALNEKYYDVQYTAEDIGTSIFCIDGVQKISNENSVNVDFKICVGGWAFDHGYFPKREKLSETVVVDALSDFKSGYVEYIRNFDVSEVNWFGNISFYKYLEFLADGYDENYAVAVIGEHYFISPFN